MECRDHTQQPREMGKSEVATHLNYNFIWNHVSVYPGLHVLNVSLNQHTRGPPVKHHKPVPQWDESSCLNSNRRFKSTWRIICSSSVSNFLIYYNNNNNMPKWSTWSKTAFSWTVRKMKYCPISGWGHLTDELKTGGVCDVILTWMATMAPSSWLSLYSFFFMLLRMTERGGMLTLRGWLLGPRISSCCHCNGAHTNTQCKR